MQRLVACVLFGCHVLCACWPCVCRCGCKTTHDTSRRTRVIPVVDRSNNSLFYIIAFGVVGVFIILSVLGLQIDTDRLKTVPLRDLTQIHSAGGVTV